MIFKILFLIALFLPLLIMLLSEQLFLKGNYSKWYHCFFYVLKVVIMGMLLCVFFLVIPSVVWILLHNPNEPTTAFIPSSLFLLFFSVYLFIYFIGILIFSAIIRFFFGFSETQKYYERILNKLKDPDVFVAIKFFNFFLRKVLMIIYFIPFLGWGVFTTLKLFFDRINNPDRILPYGKGEKDLFLKKARFPWIDLIRNLAFRIRSLTKRDLLKLLKGILKGFSINIGIACLNFIIIFLVAVFSDFISKEYSHKTISFWFNVMFIVISVLDVVANIILAKYYFKDRHVSIGLLVSVGLPLLVVILFALFFSALGG